MFTMMDESGVAFLACSVWLAFLNKMIPLSENNGWWWEWRKEGGGRGGGGVWRSVFSVFYTDIIDLCSYKA